MGFAGTWPPGSMKLHVGCGGQKLPGYVNCDVREEVSPDLVFDATGNWPMTDGCCAEVAAFHVLEHLDRHEGAHFLREAFRVLRTGGKLVLELPDLEGVIFNSFDYNSAGDYDFDRLQTDPAKNDEEPLWVLQLFGRQRNPFDYHRWMYTRESLRRAVEKAGFTVTYQGDGTDYHQTELGEDTQRLEALKP